MPTLVDHVFDVVLRYHRCVVVTRPVKRDDALDPERPDPVRVELPM